MAFYICMFYHTILDPSFGVLGFTCLNFAPKRYARFLETGIIEIIQQYKQYNNINNTTITCQKEQCNQEKFALLLLISFVVVFIQQVCNIILPFQEAVLSPN